MGYTTYSGIGKPLGYIEDVRNELSKRLDSDIPSLNALCTNSITNLPSYGFEYVIEDYDTLSLEAKRVVVDGLNKRATDFKFWDVVLNALCLTPSVCVSGRDEEDIRKGKFCNNSESQYHIQLKQYIAEHPSKIGLTNVVSAETENVLLSGDRLDVHLQQKNGTRVAVEVKSRISQDDDILRGIYQCVKYKAVLEAENRVHGVPYKVRSILVLEGTLSDSNYQVKDLLGVEVIECFEY